MATLRDAHVFTCTMKTGWIKQKRSTTVVIEVPRRWPCAGICSQRAHKTHKTRKLERQKEANFVFYCLLIRTKREGRTTHAVCTVSPSSTVSSADRVGVKVIGYVNSARFDEMYSAGTARPINTLQARLPRFLSQLRNLNSVPSHFVLHLYPILCSVFRGSLSPSLCKLHIYSNLTFYFSFCKLHAYINFTLST